VVPAPPQQFGTTAKGFPAACPTCGTTTLWKQTGFGPIVGTCRKCGHEETFQEA